MGKSRIKPHFFSLRVSDYESLIEFGLSNSAINILKHSPALFFANFQKYTREVADEFKQKLYLLCFQIATDKDRNRIESIVYSKNNRKEVKVA